MWATYRSDRSIANRNRIVAAELHLVDVAAGHVMRVTDIDDSELADLKGWAATGLIHQVERFDPERGPSFRAFALPRMIGTIRDEMRKSTWRGQFTDDPTEARRRGRRRTSKVVSSEQLGEAFLERMPDGAPLVDDSLRRAHRVIVAWVHRLPPDERDVMTMYYLDRMKVEQIAVELAARHGRATAYSKAYVSKVRQRALGRFDPARPAAGADTFGAELARLRHARGWSQERLAQTLKVSRKRVSAWEVGRTPSVARVVQLADLFEVDLGGLLALAAQSAR
jgi:RNA polymerase sigma factor (sigma-70 family)